MAIDRETAERVMTVGEAIVNLWWSQNEYVDFDEFLVDLAFPLHDMRMLLNKTDEDDTVRYVYSSIRGDKRRLVVRGGKQDVAQVLGDILERFPEVGVGVLGGKLLDLVQKRKIQKRTAADMMQGLVSDLADDQKSESDAKELRRMARELNRLMEEL